MSKRIVLSVLLSVLFCMPAAWAQSIHLNAGDVDTSRAAKSAPMRTIASEFTGNQLHLVQFAGPIQPEWMEQLTQAGYRIVDYIPENAYLVYGGSAALRSVRANARQLQWEGAYLASDKIQPRARPEALAARRAATGSDGLFAVQMVLDDAANAETLALVDGMKLAPLRSRSINERLQFLNVVVALPGDRLDEIAARPDVVSINTYVPPQRCGERQGQIVAGNLNGDGSQPTGPGYLAWLASKGFTQDQFDASGFIVDIADDGWDNGVAGTPANPEFRKNGSAAGASRVKYSQWGSTLAAAGSWGTDGHGNINISIVGGYNNLTGSPYEDAAGYNLGLGICPFANLGNTKVFNDAGEWDPTDEQELAYISSNYTKGVRISSDSWGMPGDGVYDIYAQGADTVTRDAQPGVAGNQECLFVYAAGNDGPGTPTIGAPGTAKNVLTVGAAENYNQFGTDGCSVDNTGANNANDIIDFSSRGPCTDKRIKPDIVAPGTHVQGAASFYSGYTGNGVCDKYQPAGQTNYASSSGTSHSTPAVAGGAALVYQYFINQGWSVPSPAMLKIFLMNSARYMTGVDANDNLPSNDQGIGGMNLGMAFDGTARILRDQLTNDLFTASGQSRTFYGLVSDPAKPVRITLGWTDAPGSTTGNAYKNNLDLVVSVGGVAYKGNVFSGAYSVAGGTADVRNNVESVFLPAGTTGLVQVTVSAFNVNSDGVPNYGGALDQDFALVVANATAFTPSNYPPALDAIGNKSIATNKLLQFTVSASDPIDGDSVRLWAEGVPAWATFAGATNAGAASCLFSGTTPMETNVFAVTFYAADKDGTNSESIVITVNDINCVPATLLSEGFDDSTSVPAGWTDGGTANDAVASHYSSGPNCRALGIGDTLLTPPVNNPTQIVFFVDASSPGSGQTASLDYRVGDGEWTEVGTFIVSSTGAAKTFDLSALAEIANVSFRFNSSFNTWYLDDVVVSGLDCSGGSVPNTPPTLDVAGGTVQNATTGIEMSFAVTANDADGNALTLQTNSAPADAAFPLASGTAPIQSTFTWTPMETGTFAAVFVASDGIATATQAVSIVVAAPAPELLAPVIQAPSDVQRKQFNANWLASANATGYRIDVATNSEFAAGGGGATNLSENFALFTTASSTDISGSLDEYMQVAGWTGAKVFANSGSAKLGSSSAKGYLTTPTVDLSANGGVATLKFDLGKYGSDVGLVQVLHAADGTTFVQVGADLTPPGALTTQTLEITGGTAASKIRIAAKGLSDNRFYLDNFQIVQGAPARRYVPGYQNLDVGDVTTVAVTGLTESVTYYCRVRAYHSTSNSPYSETTNATTLAAVDMPPVLAAIGNKSVVTNNVLTFEVSASEPVDGDEISLTATNLPGGATFAGATNAGTASSTFTWANAGPLGTYEVTFTATDKDGADEETVVITVGDGSTPVEIAFQGFEGTSADTWGIIDANCVLATPGAADTPANQRVRTGSYSWQPGETEALSETLELAEVDVAAYSDVVMTLHLSATCTNIGDGYGLFPTDTMAVSLALNGGSYPSAADLTVTGNELVGGSVTGALWSYTATGIAATTAGVARTLAPASGGVTDDGLATVQIAVPPGTASVKLKAISSLEYYGYLWNVDDVSLTGIADGGASDFPPAIAISPAGTAKSIAISNALNFTITGTEILNDAADEVRLWATNLPAGASFPEASGTSVLTNAFSWTPTATGTTVVSFFAGDKDGTNQLDVTITAYEQAPAGTYRAVICGISDYEGTGNDLNFCDDDAQELYDLLLTGSNWEASNVQLLLNSQATEANIQAAIASMGAASVAGDVNLFFFSGHGGDDMPDTDGDEGGDGYDEYMCPYNLTTQEITDDELSAWLDALPTDNIIVLLDTCFSGGHLKAPGGAVSKGYSRTGKDIRTVNGFVDDLRKRTPKDVNDLTSPYIATAADDDEYSIEDDPLQNGLFAYYLLEALTNSDANADGWAAGEEAFDYLYPKVVAYESTQHPQEYDGWTGLANIVAWEPLVDQPPTLALDPTGTNKVVVFGNPLSFTVTATDSDGQAVALTASGLPAGATAPDANGTGTASTTFNWTPAEGQVGTHAVTFSATDDDGTTVLGVTIRVRDGSVAADLFISEYVEGSSNNKYVEIFNGTGAAVDLSGYKLQLYANGTNSPNSDITLSGTLADGAVKVYQNSQATIYAGENNAACAFNGDDAVALYKISSGAFVDIVGRIGEDPGTAWTDGSHSTLDQTLVRKATVAEGISANPASGFPTLASEWDTYAKDTASYLGSHEFGAGEPTPPTLAAIGNRSVTEGQDLQFQVTATPTDSDAVTLTASNLPAGATFNATNENGTFQWLAASPTGVYSVSFYATDKDGTDEETISITVSEPGSELLAPVIQAASAIDATQFNANWLASVGATGYRLDVATNELFRHTMGRRTATLAAGDLVIVTVDADATEGFDAVPLVDLDAGTVITFTDNGWTNGTWRTNEGSVVYTAPGAVSAGTVLSYRSTNANGFVKSGSFDLSGSGDTILAYQGSAGSPTFLYGIGWAMATPWVAASTNSNNSGIPAGLSTGAYTIVSCGSFDNYQYDAANGTSGSPGTLLQWVANAGNWTVDDTAAFAKFTPDFTVGEVEQYNDFVPGYENLDVYNVTTFAVTGLTEGVTYYYRAKAYNVSSNSPYSAVTSVVTAASSGTPPDLNAIGGQEVFVGYDLQFQVSATPTEADAVTLTASNLPAGATFNATNQNGTFQWLAAAPTGEYSVVFYATDKDGSDGEAVGIYVYPLPQVGGFAMSNGAPASATFRSVSGQDYRLEFSTNLLMNPVVWTEADRDTGNGNDLTLSDTNAVDAKRYYRVVAP